MEQTITDAARAALYAELPALLLPWYDKNTRDLPWRANKDPYRVLVSELMLQQTRVEAAREHYIRFVRELPTAAALAACRSTPFVPSTAPNRECTAQSERNSASRSALIREGETVMMGPCKTESRAG